MCPGSAFGSLVYVLDALDEFEQDSRRGEFNALQAAFQLLGLPATPVSIRPTSSGQAPPSGHTAPADQPLSGSRKRSSGQRGSGNRNLAALPNSCRATTEAYLRELASEATAAIKALPIPAELAGMFTARLSANLDRRLNPGETGGTSSRGVLRRLAHLVRRIFQLPVLHPAHALPGGGPPVHLARGIPSTSTDGEKGVIRRKVRRVGGGPGCGCGGCGCEGCQCCGEACCEGGCECCGEGLCSACCDGCGSCGGGCAL